MAIVVVLLPKPWRDAVWCYSVDCDGMVGTAVVHQLSYACGLVVAFVIVSCVLLVVSW
jgi:hypothetical protein